ncbi:hypothetical protein KEM60_02629 [Austwickia sp. TVS 96-490-7B]|uniref:DUF4191 domain-containing protein n=1 Tax=Austwickia sp. TVS 96-490-7B TaxID=2830843 RepID=UPI001C58081F|nr:DUF4191 domain-containing protein [Austwickia sp. TVS 96-490-7B]MBW3086411.1 hypothetical protein [Austwickia sp. TVS 96-490-7B]
MARAPKDPNRPGFLARTRTSLTTRFDQFRQVFSLARSADPRLPFYLAGIVILFTAAGYLLGAAMGHPVYMTVIFLMLAVLPCLWLLARKAEAGAYGRISGQRGEVGAALGSIRRGWSYQQEPIAADTGGSRDPMQAALVYRAVGRPGVVLIAEGPTGRAMKMLSAERKRTARLIPNVPVHTFRVGTGNGPDVIATKDLIKKMNGLDKVLTKHEVPQIDKRLRSIGGQRPPIPQGIDPTKMRSKGMRPR